MKNGKGLIGAFAVAVALAAPAVTSFATTAPVSGDAPTSDRFDSAKLLTCETWAASAVFLLKGAHEKGKTVDAEAASLYDKPDPFLLSLAHTADEMERGGFVSGKKAADGMRLIHFLSGVCYATMKPSPSV